MFVSFVKNIGGSAEVAKGNRFSESAGRGRKERDPLSYWIMRAGKGLGRYCTMPSLQKDTKSGTILYYTVLGTIQMIRRRTRVSSSSSKLKSNKIQNHSQKNHLRSPCIQSSNRPPLSFCRFPRSSTYSVDRNRQYT